MTQSNQQPQNSPGNRPAFVAYQVRDRDGGKGVWTRVGAAWATKSGGFSVQLDAVPLDGRIVLQKPTENDNPEAAS